MTLKIGQFAGAALAGCALATFATSAPAEGGFGYSGDSGPAHWAELNPEWGACAEGKVQSPVDFEGEPNGEGLTLHYGPTTGKIEFDGHSIKVVTRGDDILTVDGVDYKLIQFHFHTPSEHMVDGHGYGMELHMVHQSEAGALLVLAALVKRGDSSGPLSFYFDHLPDDAHVPHALEVEFNPADFLPDSQKYYAYQGSFTTPPCTEPAPWIVMAEPITVSAQDMARYAQHVVYDARPIQRVIE